MLIDAYLVKALSQNTAAAHCSGETPTWDSMQALTCSCQIHAVQPEVSPEANPNHSVWNDAMLLCYTVSCIHPHIHSRTVSFFFMLLLLVVTTGSLTKHTRVKMLMLSHQSWKRNTFLISRQCVKPVTVRFTVDFLESSVLLDQCWSWLNTLAEIPKSETSCRNSDQTTEYW